MTQLPEVEVICKELEKEVVGKRFKEATVRTAAMVSRHRNRPEFARELEGRKIEGISRRGLHLVFRLDEGKALVLRFGPESNLTRETANAPSSRQTQFVGTFTTGGALHYVDPNRAGELFVTDAETLGELPELQVSGIDPLAQPFTWHALSEQLRTRNRPLKGLLVDESFIVGLGDLYADEILWSAGLAGDRSSASLSSQEVRRLYRAVLEVLHDAVKQGGLAGEAEADPSEHLSERGEHIGHLRVFHREGQPCPRCRQPIRRAVIDRDSGLSIYYCPQCQT